jgi:hypothetical protein
MKKSSLKLRNDIARLQDQLRQAETREAERIGRVALKAGLGEMEIDETALLSAFETIVSQFQAAPKGTARGSGEGGRRAVPEAPVVEASPRIVGEA